MPHGADMAISVCAEAKPAWFDAHNQIAGAARVLADNIVPGLLRIGDDGAPAPSLAASWQWETATCASLTLVDGARFASGRPVDARAVSENVMRVVDEGGAAFNGAEFRHIVACEANGASEVIVRMREPFAPIAGALANGFGIVDLAGGTPPANTVGAGPYVLAGRSRHAFELVGRSDAVPAVSWRFCTSARARARRIRAGTADVLIGTAGTALAETYGWRTETTPAHGPLHLAFNLRRWPTSELGFRHAVASSIDRGDLIAQGFGGLGRAGETPYPPDSAFWVGSSERAGAGPLPAGGLPELLLVVGGDAYLAVAKAVARAVERATRATVKVVSIPNPRWWPDYYMSGEWDLAVQAWTPMPDPDFVYGRRYASWGVHNACGYASARMDAAVRAAQRTVDPARRLAHYRDAEEARGSDLPTVYLSFPDRVCCVRPGVPAPRVRPSWEIQLGAARQAATMKGA
jgi:peptide/nickel transport system substrate-binding protein